MNVHFITGIAHTGKSTYIHSVLNTSDLYIDVLDIQVLFQLRRPENSDGETSTFMTAKSLTTELRRARYSNVYVEFPGLSWRCGKTPASAILHS